MGEVVSLKEYKKKMSLKEKFNRFYQKYFVIPYGHTRTRIAIVLPLFSLVVLLTDMSIWRSITSFTNLHVDESIPVGIAFTKLVIGALIMIGTFALGFQIWLHYYKYFRCRILDWYCDNDFFLGWRGLAIITAITSILCCILMKSILFVIIIASVLLVAVAVLDILIIANIPETFSAYNVNTHKRSNRRKYN